MSLMEERRRRIVTTHVGSLPRSNDLSKLLFARMTHQPYDAERLFQENRKAVREIVSKQIELGIDIISDGEQSKTSFQYYVTDRLSGIEEITPKQGQRQTRENMAFPAFYPGGAHAGSAQPKFACTSSIRYTGQSQLSVDLYNLKAALGDSEPVDAFVPSVCHPAAPG
jgi:5-methyltetrahydropteroyltriglutamate--homocysteine methyltransferase